MIASTPANMRELEDKLARLTRTAHDAGVQGVLLAMHHNIAWLTAGRSNRVDSTREAGTARLLVAADGRRFVLANAIEMPRMLDEVLAGLDFQPIEYPWTTDQNPAFAVDQARHALGDNATIGADWPLPNTLPFEPALARTRATLTEEEVVRYRALGRDTGRIVGDVCRRLTPGDDEREIAATMADALAAVQARGVVLLVGSDDRIRRYRHPVPTATRWKHVVLVATCAERDGLIVSLSRLVAAGAVPPDLRSRTRATATVFERLLDQTRPGTSGAALFAAAADAYAAVGFSQRRAPPPPGWCNRLSRPRLGGASRIGRDGAGPTGLRLESHDHGDEARRHSARPRRSTRAHHVHARLAVDCHQPARLRPRGRRRLAPGLKVR